MNRELINSKGPLPMRLSELNPPESGKTWREELCLFLVIWGAAEVIVGETRSLLRDEDIIVINPNAVFEIRSTDCGALMLYIGLDALGGADGQPAFDCDSSKAEDKAAFYTLKHLCATFLKENSGGTENNIFFNNALAFSILSELQKFFPVKENTGAAIAAKNADRIKSIINEINAHYREGVTLKDLARSQNFSVPYFSAFFKRCFGVGFTEYYNDFRLERAVSELLSSEQPIENIAHNHGFTDVRSFVALFKKRYGLLPSAYRKEMAPPAGGTEYESGLYTLSKYLPPPQNQLPVSKMPASEEKRADAGKISVLGGTPLKHTFRAFTSVGRAKELLYADVQEMLAEFQNEIGFRYIKFHGILSDDMLLYGENDKGEARYSFVMLDKAIDFLMSIKLKPLVQFSFMPKRLASDKDETLFFSPFNISMPKDLNKWQGLIKAVTEHFIERYGLNAVKQWLFCVWNEPNLIIWTPPPSFGADIIFELYKSTREAVKRVHKGLMFGMPALAYDSSVKEWAAKFFNMCRRHNCMPDFCNLHYYDNDLSDEDYDELQSLRHQTATSYDAELLMKKFRQNSNENAFKNAIPAMRAMFDAIGAGSLPIYITEWNMTVSHRNLLNDTCFKACYLAKNILENYDAMDSFGHWSLTDLIEETQPSNEHFHGGLGLLTHSGIKKASYHVFTLLNRLGDRLVKRGDGFFITKSHGHIQIILYNYEHFSHLFASGETFDMSFTKRYAPFLKLAKLNVSLTLTDLPAKKCVIRERVLNWKHGSAFDAWVEMGARPLSPDDAAYLKRISVPKIYLREEDVPDGVLDINAVLEPLEVRLIEITL